jgi:hypothetical protein
MMAPPSRILSSYVGYERNTLNVPASPKPLAGDSSVSGRHIAHFRYLKSQPESSSPCCETQSALRTLYENYIF